MFLILFSDHDGHTSSQQCLFSLYMLWTMFMFALPFEYILFEYSFSIDSLSRPRYHSTRHYYIIS